MGDRTTEFDDFATQAWPRLYRAAYLLCGDHHLAQDLTQITLIRTFSSWRRVRRHDALAYARRVLVNLNIDRLRRKHFREVTDEGRPEPMRADDHAVEDRDELVRLLATLSDRERQVVVLRHYFDLSEAQVAAELSIAVGTVKSTLARALNKLRISAQQTSGPMPLTTGGTR